MENGMVESYAFITVKKGANTISQTSAKQPDQPWSRKIFDQRFNREDDYPAH